MTKLEIRQQPIQHPTRQDRRRNIEDEYEGMLGDDFEDDEHATFVNYGGNERRNARRNKDRVNCNVRSIKIKIPHFQGKNDPYTYLECERKVEHVFDCHNYSNEKKVKLLVVEFTDYALIWWDQLVFTIRKNRERPIDTWEEIKVIMRRIFIRSHYYMGFVSTVTKPKPKFQEREGLPQEDGNSNDQSQC